MTLTTGDFDHCIRMLCSESPLTYEEGFHWLIGHVDDHVDQIIERIAAESNPSLRGKLVEVLGHSNDSRVIPILIHELEHDSREVRMWAYNMLSCLGTEEAVTIATCYRNTHPNEDFY